MDGEFLFLFYFFLHEIFVLLASVQSLTQFSNYYMTFIIIRDSQTTYCTTVTQL